MTFFLNLEILTLNKLVDNIIGIMIYTYYINIPPPAMNHFYNISNSDFHNYCYYNKSFVIILFVYWCIVIIIIINNNNNNYYYY